MRIDPADKAFSLYIRERDNWTCQRCKHWFDQNLSYERQALDNSHFFGRGKENTRFDPENCDALCYGCHRIWEKEDREDYRRFKVRQLGEAGFAALELRSKILVKKDRAMQRFIWENAYAKLVGLPPVRFKPIVRRKRKEKPVKKEKTDSEIKWYNKVKEARKANYRRWKSHLKKQRQKQRKARWLLKNG